MARSTLGLLDSAAYARRHLHHRFHRISARSEPQSGLGGWAGPVFWPYAYDDILDFAYWPGRHDDRFLAYGYSNIVEALLGAPTRYDYLYDRSQSPIRSIRAEDRADRTAAASPAPSLACGSSQVPGSADWVTERVKQAVEPTEAQRAAFEKLEAASVRSVDRMKAVCPSAVSATPRGRLDAMARRLSAIANAMTEVQAPLSRFYRSLSDEQKARFNAIGVSTNAAAYKTGAGDVMAACGEQASRNSKWPIKRIEQVVRPSPEQRPALEGLRAALMEAASSLAADCSAEVPATPPARLDFVASRLRSMRYALLTVRAALNVFYATLNDQQTARFDAMREPQRMAGRR